MRFHRLEIILIVLALIIMGCSSALPIPGTTIPDSRTQSPCSGTGCNPATPDQVVTVPVVQNLDPCTDTGCDPAAPELGKLSYIFNTTPKPVDVVVILETSGTVESLIPVEGGTISAAAADGTLYMLEIPADALLEETLIGLTPVTSISGIPFGSERTYAVQLSPEGLFFQNFAILTITPAVEIPIGEQIMFGYQGIGSDLLLAAPVADSSEIKINVLHFSGYGVTSGSMDIVASVHESLGGNIEQRMQSAVAERIGIERQRQLLGISQGNDPAESEWFTEALKQYEEQVINPLVAAAGDSCEAGKLAQNIVLAHERQLQLLGVSNGNGPDKYPGLHDKVARKCMLEEFEACVQYHRIFLILPLYEGLLRQNEILHIYSPGTLNEARDMTIKCLTFKLAFQSAGKLDANGSGYDSSVTSELILRYNPEKGIILGAVSELVNTDFTFRFPGCGATSIPGGGEFAALGLSYEIETGAPDKDGSYPDAGIRDFKLVYTPGNTSETATINPCQGAGAVPLPPAPLWTSTFIATHKDELGEGGYTTIDWKILGDDLFARKEWNLVSTVEGKITEIGSFELYHTPGL